MKTALIILAIVLANLALTWACIAFVTLETNPLLWSVDVRGGAVFAFFGAIFSAWFISLFVLIGKP